MERRKGGEKEVDNDHDGPGLSYLYDCSREKYIIWKRRLELELQL